MAVAVRLVYSLRVLPARNQKISYNIDNCLDLMRGVEEEGNVESYWRL